MPRRLDAEDEWDEDFDPADEDADQDSDDGEESTVPCPCCRRQIHEDTERCPYCEHYVSEEDAQPSRKPWWIIVTALVCLYMVYLWIVNG
jgi:uncharacterized paraquat-inducible protein A